MQYLKVYTKDPRSRTAVAEELSRLWDTNAPVKLLNPVEYIAAYGLVKMAMGTDSPEKYRRALCLAAEILVDKGVISQNQLIDIARKAVRAL